MKKREPRFMVFPALGEGDGKNWIVRGTKGAEKLGDGKIIKAFRVLENALNFARDKNKALTKRS